MIGRMVSRKYFKLLTPVSTYSQTKSEPGLAWTRPLPQTSCWYPLCLPFTGNSELQLDTYSKLRGRLAFYRRAKTPLTLCEPAQPVLFVFMYRHFGRMVVPYLRA